METLSDAIGWADRVRTARADLVAAVGSGADTPAVLAAIESIPEVGATYAVVVTQAVPGLGKIGARRRLESLGIDEFAAIGSLAPAVIESLLVPGDRPNPRVEVGPNRSTS